MTEHDNNLIEIEDNEPTIEYAVDTEMQSLFQSTLHELKPVEKMTGFELAKFVADKALLLEQSVSIINDIVSDFRTHSPETTEELYDAFKFIELAGTTMSNHFLAWAYARQYLFARQNARINK
jgi:hypothetical protein